MRDASTRYGSPPAMEPSVADLKSLYWQPAAQ
jgi:hypothetical protein